MLVQGGLKFVNALVSYPGCWIIDQLPEAEFIGEIELRLMETYPNRYAELSMKFNELIDWFGYENCDQQKERLDKFYQTFSQIISFFSKNGLSGIIDQAFTALGTYFSGLAGFDNEERYKQGKLVFAIASIFVPAGAGAKVLDKLSDTLGKLTKKIDDFLRGKGDDAAKVLTDDFAEAMAYLKSLDDPALIAKMDEDLIIGSKEFLEFISEKGVDGVNAWKDWIAFPNLRKRVDLLENYYPKRSKILLDVEEIFPGCHSIARHGPHLPLDDMRLRVIGQHPTLGQSRSALKFDTPAIHDASVNKAFTDHKVEIEAHFANGGGYREWDSQLSGRIGEGYTNTGTINNPSAQYVTTDKVKITFDVDPNNPTGYKMISGYPWHEL